MNSTVLSGKVFGATWASFIAKIAGFILQMMTLVVVANEYSREQFGIFSIFLTLAVLSPCFDLGFGGPNLRNQLADLKHQPSTERIANTYFLSIILILLAVYACISGIVSLLLHHFDIQSVLSIQDPELAANLPELMMIFFVFLCMRIPFSMSSDGFYAYHEAHIQAVFEVVERIILLCVALLFALSSGSFFWFICCFFCTYVGMAKFQLFYFLFRRGWSIQVKITLQSLLKILSRRSSKILFFWMQNVLGVLLFTQIPLVMGMLLDASISGKFLILQKPLAIVIEAHYIILNPLWTGFSDAKHFRDSEWIEKMFSGYLIFTMLGFFILVLFVVPFHGFYTHLFFEEPLFDIQLASDIIVWSLFFALCNLAQTFLNAMNEIRLPFIALSIGFCVTFIMLVSSSTYSIHTVMRAFLIAYVPVLLILYAGSIRLIGHMREQYHLGKEN